MTLWRRERDSNPRYPFRHNGFQDRRYQPLTHPSAAWGLLSSLPYRRFFSLRFVLFPFFQGRPNPDGRAARRPAANAVCPAAQPFPVFFFSFEAGALGDGSSGLAFGGTDVLSGLTPTLTVA